MAPFSNEKIADIWNFWWIKYLVKGLSYLRNWGIGVNYWWKYGLSKLLLHFIEYCVDQLNSKHTKTVVNLTIQYFEDCSQQKCLLKVFWCTTRKWWPWKMFVKLNRNHLLMANIFKLHEYQAFGLMNMHNRCKIWFANKIFSLLRWNKKVFFMIFQGLSITRNRLRSETAPLTTLDIKRGLLCNFTKSFKGCHFMGHSDKDF